MDILRPLHRRPTNGQDTRQHGVGGVEVSTPDAKTLSNHWIALLLLECRSEQLEESGIRIGRQHWKGGSGEALHSMRDAYHEQIGPIHLFTADSSRPRIRVRVRNSPKSCLVFLSVVLKVSHNILALLQHLEMSKISNV